MPAGAAPLANVDSAWLRMDHPDNRMVVTGVLMLDEPVSVDRIREVIASRLLRFPRFSQRVAEGATPMTPPSWQKDPEFDISNHLRVEELDDPADERALERLVSRLMVQPFDPAHPLWQFHHVPRYNGGSAIICRVHHCIGDGLALIYVMLSVADDGAALADLAAESSSPGASSPWDSVAKALTSTVGAGAALPGLLLRQVTNVVTTPGKMGDMSAQVANGIAALGKLLAMPSEPATSLKGPLIIEKQAAWSRPIPLADVKAIGRETGATINDILISAVAGGLRRYLLSRGTTIPPELSVRAVVPVNLRPPAEAWQLGNQFGLVFLSLPLGIEQPLGRLFEVRSRMNSIKRSPEAYLTFQLLKAIGTAPRQIFNLVVDLFQRKATAVMTNVIGPRQPIRVAGAQLRQAMFWVPCAGRLGLGISVLSYAGNVSLGVATDAQVIPEPHCILQGFEAELNALRRFATPGTETGTTA